MDSGMLEPSCCAYQIPGCYRFSVSNRRMFHFEVKVDFLYLPEPPRTTTDRQDDRLIPDLSRSEIHEFSYGHNQLSQDAVGEQTVREMLMEAGVMYTPYHLFMVPIILARVASVASDERNRDVVVLPMRVQIVCADPHIHRELMVNEHEGRVPASNDSEHVDLDIYEFGDEYEFGEDNDEEEEEEAKTWRRLEALAEVGVTEGSITCAICCDDIPVGSTGSSMPCRHPYHRECIAKWLRKRSTCPLCRFELPSTD